MGPVRLRFRRRNQINPMTNPTISTTTAIAIPALPPALRPLDLDDSDIGAGARAGRWFVLLGLSGLHR